MGGGRGAHRVLVGKPEGKRPLRRYGHRWEIILRGIFRQWNGGGGGGKGWFFPTRKMEGGGVVLHTINKLLLLKR